MYKIMTAGPTTVKENVRMARSLEATNPDLDPAFFDFYRETCKLLSKSVNTANEAFIMGGEGILGLEAACASLTEPGDRVLVIDNGIFGNGFKDFITMYEGEPVLYTSDYQKPVDIDDLKSFLSKDHDFKYATLVHLDTPSGVLNNVEEISKLLNSYGILTVCDSVAGLYGEKLNLANSQIDILCGGSQKALSVPPGLTMVWVSERAFNAMESRKHPIRAYYANLLMYRGYYENRWFPYTMPAGDIMGLRVALDNYFVDENVYKRHEKIANAVRKAVVESGLKLYLKEGFSNNVTVIELPEGVTEDMLLDEMRETHKILISGCFGVLKGKVFRIGHMGENCYDEPVAETLEAIEKSLATLGVKLKKDIKRVFLDALD